MDRRLAARPQRVLVVDDNPDTRGLWSIWLTHFGFDVEEAANGADAVQQAVERPPDLVLMDLWMPVMDGLTAIERLKSNARTAAVPVIALSAHGNPPVPSRATAVGAEVFLQKPCDFDVLMHGIRLALGKAGRDARD
jgi:CheY-like chemotaxis protein